MVRALPDPAYVPPKGGYDAPGTFARKFDAVGETCECSLGTPISNAYQRQVRLKAQGLENLCRLTALQQDIDESAAEFRR